MTTKIGCLSKIEAIDKVGFHVDSNPRMLSVVVDYKDGTHKLLNMKESSYRLMKKRLLLRSLTRKKNDLDAEWKKLMILSKTIKKSNKPTKTIETIDNRLHEITKEETRLENDIEEIRECEPHEIEHFLPFYEM
jgi:hypothetical protein